MTALRIPWPAALLAFLTLTAGGSAWGDDPTPKPTPKRTTEEAVLAFVGEHQPELASLLDSLRSMRPAEYQKAIRQLSQVVQSLQSIRGQNPERYAMGLEAWKAKTRVELVTARLASHVGPVPEQETALRQALEDQLAVEVRARRHDRDQAEARARRLTEDLRRLEADPAGVVEARFQALLNKTRPMGEARAATAKTNANTKAKAKAKPTTTTTTRPGQSQKERPR